jgi:hypothetical protein
MLLGVQLLAQWRANEGLLFNCLIAASITVYCRETASRHAAVAGRLMYL